MIFSLVLLLVVGAVSAQATPMVSIQKVTEMLEGSVYTYTVVLKNSGDMDAVDYSLTAQPYDDKPNDAAKKQEKKNLTIPAGAERTFEFMFTGAEGKDWKWQYTDVYDQNGKFVAGQIGEFDFLPVPAGPSLAAVIAFDFPYPDPVTAENAGPVSFFIEVTGASVPEGWAVSIDPRPGSPFTLDAGQAQLVQVLLASQLPTSPGDLGFVTFDFVQPTFDFRFHSHAGVRVTPEPSTFIILGAVLVGLAGFAWRRYRR